jgi:DNA (cytosine-5)-methyltransferase 1
MAHGRGKSPRVTAAAAYYNEIDPYAAQWLRNLIAAGHIAPGDVDERSIEDVHPDDLKPYAQCHFFAGIGVWSHALRRAGWPDDRPVWTGSCPCQPFSAAGKGAAFDDERHLWPAFHWLIAQRRPAVVFGEQVASKAVDPWIDLVHADLEAVGYTFGAVPFPSAGVGAPHIRDRLFWMGHANDARLEGHAGNGGSEGRSGQGGSAPAAGVFGGVADSARGGRREERQNAGGVVIGDRAQGLAARPRPSGSNSGPGPVNGLWGGADWLLCRDGKWRAVEPGTFPLAHGAPARVGRLRAYGNAINAEAAAVFVGSMMEAVTC